MQRNKNYETITNASRNERSHTQKRLLAEKAFPPFPRCMNRRFATECDDALTRNREAILLLVNASFGLIFVW
jgi:hypothetical protein